jgi:DNA processing protein
MVDLMTQEVIAQAATLAATEVAPADWRDVATVLEDCGGPYALIRKSRAVNGQSCQLLSYFRSAIDDRRVSYWSDRLAELTNRMPNVRFITVDSAAYPVNLKTAYGRPPFLFVDGSISEQDGLALAIVGSRNASQQGLAAARNVAKAAAAAGVTVVSGLARGIDAAAHRAAIEAGGRTIAVIAGGIDRPYTRESDDALAPLIPHHGAIVSQFRPGSPPTSNAFVIRNSVISGLSLVSFLAEASERSGTRSEADFAVQQGRKVLLWRKAFEEQQWAQRYADNPRVTMVDGAAEVIAEIQASAGGSQANE